MKHWMLTGAAAASLICATSTRPEVFCANDSAELQQFLDLAAINGEDDEVRIHQGAYVAPAGGFVYDSDETFDIEITGGWTGRLGSCGGQGIATAFDTTLDGDTRDRVLTIDAGLDSDIRVDRLLFANGSASVGAGLLIEEVPADPFEGDLLIERCGFINNTADATGSALFASGGGTLRLRNNLFSGNTGRNVVHILQVDATGTYFTNNTVVSNFAAGNAGALFAMGDSAQLLVANNIFWQNDGFDLNLSNTGQIHLRDNDIEDGQNVPATQLSVDPLFEPGLFNFTLSPGSPLIDHGTEPPSNLPINPPFEDNWGLGTQDFLGDDRIRGDGVDIGAYEAPPDLLFANGFE